MKSFLEKVRSATTSIGRVPYDDKKTFGTISEATKRTVEYYEKIKNKKTY